MLEFPLGPLPLFKFITLSSFYCRRSTCLPLKISAAIWPPVKCKEGADFKKNLFSLSLFLSFSPLPFLHLNLAHSHSHTHPHTHTHSDKVPFSPFVSHALAHPLTFSHSLSPFPSLSLSFRLSFSLCQSYSYSFNPANRQTFQNCSFQLAFLSISRFLTSTVYFNYQHYPY